MGAIFHFYNSDEEDDDDTPAAKARAAKKLAKEQQALVSLVYNYNHTNRPWHVGHSVCMSIR